MTFDAVMSAPPTFHFYTKKRIFEPNQVWIELVKYGDMVNLLHEI